MRLGMSTAAFYGRGDTEALAARMGDWGLDCCEVFLETPSEYTAAFGCVVRRALSGLECVSVHPMGSQFEAQLYAVYHRQREDALRLFEGVCDAGQALGARYYVLHGPFRVRGGQRLEDVHDLGENTRALLERARERGMEVLWENVSWCALRGPEDVAWLRARFQDLGFVLDVKQATECDVAPENMVRAMGPRLRHLHLMDRDGAGRLCLPGEGVVDWRALRAALDAVGYGGDAILEPYEQQAGDADRLRRSLDFLRGWLA